jgi:uncharacterized protein involved in exopolysaccharide biosynthesis
MQDGMSISDVFSNLGRRWKIIVPVVLLSSLLALTYGLMRPETFRISARLAPVKTAAGGGYMGQLGGLASLAGINIGSGGESTENFIYLGSAEFARKFLKNRSLIEKLLPAQVGSMAAQEAWKNQRDAAKIFLEENLRVREEKGTGIVSLDIYWPDPEEGSRILDMYIEDANEELRSRAREASKVRMDILQRRLTADTAQIMTETIAKLIEAELQREVLVAASPDYAFRVVDRSGPPKFRDSPKRALLVVLGGLVGFVFASIFVLILDRTRLRPAGSA